jgi:hypothetical protein
MYPYLIPCIACLLSTYYPYAFENNKNSLCFEKPVSPMQVNLRPKLPQGYLLWWHKNKNKDVCINIREKNKTQKYLMLLISGNMANL